jgi:hypothetical protein
MQGGFAFSIGVHALILFLLIVGLPFLRVKPPEQQPMISVELVQVGKQTTTNRVSPANRLEKQPQPEQPPPPPQPPRTAPEPTPEPAKPPPPREVMDTPAPDLEPVDSEIQPLATPELTVKEQLKAPPQLAELDETSPKLVAPRDTIKPKFAPAPTLTPVEEKVAALIVPPKEALKRPEPKPPAKSFDSILNHVLKDNAALKNLEKNETQDTPENSPPQPQRTPTRQATGAQAPLSSRMTQSELDAVQQQLNGCMNWPDGASSRPDLIVQLDVTVNPDRTVASARVVDQAQMASDSLYAASARAALRALRVARCNPLDLPQEKYQEWQTMTINLRPQT